MPEKPSDTALMPTIVGVDGVARTLRLGSDRMIEVAARVERNPGSTIEPAPVRPDSLERRAVAELGGERARLLAEGLTIGATIGEGGMGIVRAATQRSVGRKVAVKTLKPEARSEEATLRLLREAWVTGLLEHPNVVPVYDVGLGEDGSPIIVLKHIEGSPWSALLKNGALVQERFGAEDVLEYHLRILVQVCNAVSLAHARGILHRDLKPENVMIGSFGEVYLVDWGIAISLLPDPSGRLPVASASTEMAGTPQYMAPEMLGGVGGTLSERTDVYLLGAVLFEILTGRPPHAGATFREIVASILLSNIEVPSDLPRELAEILRRALAPEPAARFASAEELRLRVEWYLRHRGSLVLSAEAALRVRDMRTVLAAGGNPDELRDRVHHLFAEARFGFRQAVRACDDNQVARHGLGEATELVVEYELASGTPEAAAAALAELDSPPPELATRVAAAMRARDAEKKRVADLEKLSADLDPLIGMRTRFAVAGMLGVFWTINPEVAGWLYAQHPSFPYWVNYVITLIITATAAVILIWGRESLLKTLVNRRAIAVVGVMFASQLTLQIGGNLLSLPYATLFPLMIFSWFVCTAMFAVLVDRRFWPAMIAFLLCFVWACAVPAHCFHAMTVCNFALLVNVLTWSRPAQDASFFVERMSERLSGAGRRRER